MNPNLKVHGPDTRYLRQLYCGSARTANVKVSDNPADWTCGRCLSTKKRRDGAVLPRGYQG